jgi:hypothetical protein
MTAADHLGVYAEGWTNGDADKILSSVTNDYVFDDPNTGQIPKAEFAAYLAEFHKTVDSLRAGAADDGPFMELSEVVTSEADGVLTAWCWWAIPGTPIQGSGLIKVADEGVQSERITFYTKLPE